MSLITRRALGVFIVSYEMAMGTSSRLLNFEKIKKKINTKFVDLYFYDFIMSSFRNDYMSSLGQIR